MFVTIINDCRDVNAMGRQLTKVAALFGCPVIPVGINHELEAAGNLIDVLDAAEDREGVVLVNVAPRHGNAKKWPNGTPFGYFYYKNILVVSSVDGLVLSLVKKYKLVDEIKLLDIESVLVWLEQHGHIQADELDHIIHTQFRSLEFTPRVAKWLKDGFDLPFENYSLDKISETPETVWFIDNFGNCKTTLFNNEFNFVSGQKVATRFGDLICYDRLKDVPDGEPGLIIGSSGLGDKKFLEIVIQGKSATDKFGLNLGDDLLDRSKIEE